MMTRGPVQTMSFIYRYLYSRIYSTDLKERTHYCISMRVVLPELEYDETRALMRCLCGAGR
jgi:hypothetical protein